MTPKTTKNLQKNHPSSTTQVIHSKPREGSLFDAFFFKQRILMLPLIESLYNRDQLDFPFSTTLSFLRDTSSHKQSTLNREGNLLLKEPRRLQDQSQMDHDIKNSIIPDIIKVVGRTILSLQLNRTLDLPSQRLQEEIIPTSIILQS